MASDRARRVVGLLLVPALMLGTAWWIERGTDFGSRHAFFGGRAIEPPDGSLVFSRTGEASGSSSLQVLSTGGGPPRALVEGLPPLGRFAWSPDGTRVVYLTGTAQRPRLQVSRAVPGGPAGRVKTPPDDLYDAGTGAGTLAWSPDGSAVAFVADLESEPTRRFRTVDVAPVSGERVGTARSLGPAEQERTTCITRSRLSRRCFRGPTGEPDAVVWLPGRGGIVYRAWVSGDTEVTDDEVKSAPDVTRIERLQPDRPRAAPELLVEVKGSLDQLLASPDGRYLLYGQVNGETRVMDLSADDPARSTRRLGRSAVAPAWSPDGRRLVFVVRSRVYTAAADGSDAHAVSHMNGYGLESNSWLWQMARQAIWSPDGRHIAWVGARRSQAVVVVMNADGTGQTPIHESPDSIELLRWIPGT